MNFVLANLVKILLGIFKILIYFDDFFKTVCYKHIHVKTEYLFTRQMLTLMM